ncbi:hypothetical protein ACJ41O_007190 [Fusarium nematophilum]
MALRKTFLAWAVFGFLGVESGPCKPTSTTSTLQSITSDIVSSITAATTTATTATTATTLTSTTAEACQTIANPGFDVNGGESWTGNLGEVNFVDLGSVAHSPPGVAELVVNQLGADSGSAVSQKLTTHCLTVGQPYFLDFYFRAAEQAAGDDCRIGTYFDGVAQTWAYTHQPAGNQDSNGWTQFEGLFFSPSAEPTIEMRVWCLAFDASGSNQIIIDIDDVSIRFADIGDN